MTTTKLDLLNIGGMLVAFGLATAFPYEVFLLAYAVLGPLHYLTEISWLHDRKNFCAHRVDAVLLILPAAFVALGFGVMLRAWHSPFLAALTPELMVFAFLSALVYSTVKTVRKRLAGLLIVALGTLLFALLGSEPYGARYWVGLFLPTLIHVFVFTAAFLLLGALRHRSWTGLASLAVFALAAACCFLNPFAAWSRPPGDWAKAHFAVFAPLNSGLCLLLGLQASDSKQALAPFHDVAELYASRIALQVKTFIAFAYLYHYLNWFSKTSLIGWHRISKKRVGVILVAWLASVGLYAWSYEAGLGWLALLSLSHVTLEFPLNWLSMKEIGFRLGTLTGLRGPVPEKAP